MVKILFLLFFLFSCSFANNLEKDPLTQKIQSLVSEDTYIKNKRFIQIIFSPKSSFYTHNKLNVVKIISNLIDNNLLSLHFHTKQELKLNFKTFGSPLFFVKLMSDSLRNIGYYRYRINTSTFDNLQFLWSISLKANVATNPLLLQKELKTIGCKIIDIERITATEWTYTIDMIDAFLNVPLLTANNKTKINRSIESYWLNVSQIDKLFIESSRQNHWYPYIAYYDDRLKLIDIVTRDKKVNKIILHIPTFTKYIKISDIYTMKNIKNGLTLYSKGTK